MFLEIAKKLTGKQLRWSLFFNNGALTQVLFYEFCKVFRAHVLQNTSRRLFLCNKTHYYNQILHSILMIIYIQALRSRGQRGEDSSPLPPSPSPQMVQMGSLNVLLLKEVTKNVHENQQAKSRAN